MKIQPINNYPPCKTRNTNFNGKFKTNAALQELRNYASKKNLENFRNILQQMKNIDDNFVYWVEKCYWSTGSWYADFKLYKQFQKSDYKGEKEILCLFDSYDTKSKSKRLGYIVDALKKEYNKNSSANTLENINKEIDKLLIK